MLLKMMEGVWTEYPYYLWVVEDLCARTFLDPISKNISTCTAVKICGHWKQYVPNAFSDSEENQNDLVIPMQLMKNELVHFS